MFRGLARPPEASKERFTTRIYEKELPAGDDRGQMQPPGEARGGVQIRVGLEVVLFPAVWGLSRGSLPSARGYSPLYRMRRPTARMLWTAQPMRPPQRDREAESPAFPSRHHGGCGKPVPSAAGVPVS